MNFAFDLVLFVVLKGQVSPRPIFGTGGGDRGWQGGRVWSLYLVWFIPLGQARFRLPVLDKNELDLCLSASARSAEVRKAAVPLRRTEHRRGG